VKTTTNDSPGQVVEGEASVRALSRLLAEALAALGRAGHPDTANRIAGRAWALLRHEHPAEAQRINALMHGLVKLPSLSQNPTEEDRMSSAELELDVRTEVPARRHELIFDTYEGLGAGEGFTLVNDHDPKPLYYQFAAEHEGEFSWDYLEQGPEVWRVRIGRTP
jgi:uncharacterized protein (DUF2249 family)